MIKNFIFSSP